MPEQVTVAGQLRLHLRSRGAGAEARQQRGLVEIEQPVHALQRDVEHRAIRSGHLQVADHAGAATIGDDDGAEPLRLGQGGGGFLVRGGQGHAVGQRTDAAEAQRDPVRKTLAACMAQAHLRRGVEQAAADARGRRRGKRFGEAGIARRRRRPHRLLQEGARAVVQRIVAPFLTPAVPGPHAPPFPCATPMGRTQVSMTG